MANYYTDNDDIRYYVEKGIDWEPLVKVSEYGFRCEDGFKNTAEATEFYREILQLVGEFSAEKIAPVAKAVDEKGLKLVDGEVVFPEELQNVMDEIQGMELHGMCMPRELGGMNCPLILYFLNSELMARADVSMMAHHSFHGGIAMALLMYSVMEGSTKAQANPPMITETRWGDAMKEIAAGEAWGSMDITEPNAGSDMAALRAVGEQDEEGQWYITGQKIFITSGHGKYHVVIARTEKTDANDAFAGLKGLSLFMVPAFQEDENGEMKRVVTIDTLEEKLGHHGSATVAVGFDRVKGELIGKRGEGFKLMLLLMNNARIGVGFESLGLCEAAYRLAKAYAEERPSMGKTIDRHEMIAEYLENMQTDIQGIRAICVHAAFHEELAQKLQVALKLMPEAIEPTTGMTIKEVEKRRQYHQKASRAVTPLLKYYAAEKAVEMARMAVQLHGGVGYTQEYGAEKLLRDAMVFPIYEGTSQIQSLMAMKDNLMQAVMNPADFVKAAARAKAQSVAARSPQARRVAKIHTFAYGALQHLLSRIAVDRVKAMRDMPLSNWSAKKFADFDPKRDFAPAMLHAERLCQLLIYKSVSEIMLDQAEKHPERMELLERYLEKTELHAEYLHKVITTQGGRMLKKLADMEANDQAMAAE